MSLVEAVAREICKQAGRENTGVCGLCDRTNPQDPICMMWQSFRREAEVAIRKVREYDASSLPGAR